MKTKDSAKGGAIAVIGGTGLYDIEGLEVSEQIESHTPFGTPSSPITKAQIDGTELLFLSRHGRHHSISPSEINHRANIFALKELGATCCIAVCAVGSFREELRPGDMVVPDQIIDRTKSRPSTFFEGGIVAHIPFAEPFCPDLRNKLKNSSEKIAAKYGKKTHSPGTYLCMEGPQFSTKAESLLYKSWKASIIGMTAIPEAKLAREAEIPYALLAMVTDYDCWREDEGVDCAAIGKILKNNGKMAQDVLKELAKELNNFQGSKMATEALRNAIITPASHISEEKKRQLAPLIGRYISQ